MALAKEKVTEGEAVVQCLDEVAAAMRQSWPVILHKLWALPVQPAPLDTLGTESELVLAVMAVQIQGLENKMPADQALRISNLTLELCSRGPSGEPLGDLFVEYDRAWKRSLAHAEVPTLGIARLLYDRLGFPPPRNEQTVWALAEILVEHGCLKWWKDFLAVADLEPGD
jgi:hypothetical protein